MKIVEQRLQLDPFRGADTLSSCEAYVNVKRCGKFAVIAVCDADILGETFKERGIVLQVKEEFYKGVKVSVEEAIEMIKGYNVANLVGKNIVSKAVEVGLVHEEAILVIEGVPHAMIMRMKI